MTNDVVQCHAEQTFDKLEKPEIQLNKNTIFK